MQTTQNATNHNEYRSIPVTALVESASNPRKRFDETSLNELAASLKTQGVLAPLLVREADENKYEVIAGARPPSGSQTCRPADHSGSGGQINGCRSNRGAMR